MRRFSAVVLWFLVVGLAALAGCGGAKKVDTTTGVPASIQLTPATLSIDLGPAGLGNTATIVATVLDANGGVASDRLSPTISFRSSNPALAGITAGGPVSSGRIAGVVCGGAWDPTFVVCNPGQVGTAQIVATGGGLTSNPITVYVHPTVDNIVVSPTMVNCKSQGQTQQMTARAFSNGVDITSTVGPFTWMPQVANVVNVSDTVDGLLTAKTPGATPIVAKLSGTNSNNSLPATFVTCALKSIKLHVDGAPDTTSATVAAGGSQALVYDAVDILGAPLTGLTLTVASLNPGVGTAALPAASAKNDGTATGIAPGTTSLVPMCLSPSCNANLPLQYGNVFTLTVSGTPAPVVYAGSTAGKSLVPIDTSKSPPVAGTAITLLSQPNSLLFAPGGAKLFLGSDTNGSMVIDTPSNSVETATGPTGKVLAAAPDGNRFVITEPAVGRVFVTDVSSSTVPLDISGATGAAFSPDGSILYIVAGNTLFVYTPGTTLKRIALGATANDVVGLTPGWFMYIAGTGSITARATCDNSPAGTVGATSPSMIASLPNGTAVVATDSPNLEVVHVNSTGAGCPPAASNVSSRVDVGEAFTARQIIPLPDSSKVYITSNVGLFVYDVAANSVSKIALAGGAIPFTGGATLDSATVYVGATDNAVHAISVSSGTDTLQIPLTFTPDLVGVTPR